MPNATCLDECPRKIRQKYGIDPQEITRTSDCYCILTNSLQHIVKEMLDDFLATLAAENPWIRALLATLEVCLAYQTDTDRLWRAICGTCAAEEALNNTFCFKSVATSSGRLRIWMALSLMDKSFARQILLIGQEIRGGYVGLHHGTISSLVASLDPIDLSIYIEEGKVDTAALHVDWNELFIYDDLINYRLLNIRLPHGDGRSNGAAGNLQNILKVQIAQKTHLQEENRQLHSRIAQLEAALDEMRRSTPKDRQYLRIRILEEQLKMSELIRAEQRQQILLQNTSNEK